MLGDETIADHEGSSSAGEAEILLRQLQERADGLLSELKVFQSCLRSTGFLQEVEVGFFRKGVESEVKSLKSVSEKYTQTLQEVENLEEPQETRFLHALRSSNLPFYEAVWYTARECKGVLSLGKRISLRSGLFKTKREFRRKDDKFGVVDIVADDGLEWIKVSTVTEKRLLFDIAKEGWECYGDDSDTEGGSDDEVSNVGVELEIVQFAKHLQKASQNYRVRYQHPKVRFVLPKLREGINSQIDAVIADIRATGAIVSCAPPSRNGNNINDLFHDLRLTPADYTKLIPSTGTPVLTQMLNIDCTVLLALISDISHIAQQDLPPTPPNQSGHYHKAILKQIDIESHQPLLPNEVYPLLQGRKLVCTDHAATRMREIVETMGTESERQRSEIFFRSSSTSTQLIEALVSTSIHPIPTTLNLPIEVVHFDGTSTSLSSSTHAPKISAKDISLAHRLTYDTPILHEPQSRVQQLAQPPPARFTLSKINRSVFLYGWLHDIVTITSNKVVAVQLRKRIDEMLDADERAAQQINQGSEERVEGPEEKNGGLENGTGGEGVGNGDGVHGDDNEGMNEFVGPRIYVCETARSLIGKEKQIKYGGTE